MDWIINIGFILIKITKLIAIPMNIRVDHALGRKFNKMLYVIEDDSIYIMLLVFLSINYGLSPAGLWCRLIRIIVLTPTFLLAFPRLSILLGSITKAFGSISVTVILFIYLIMVYTLFGHLLFKLNDPYHFGTYSLSLWSFFHLAVFDNWSEMWYINYGGCDSFPSEMVMNLQHSKKVELIKTRSGSFEYPVCGNPAPFPVASTIIFLSFTFVCGYICVNMIMAAVVIGVKNGLDEFKHVEVAGADKDDGPSPNGSNSRLNLPKGVEKQGPFVKDMTGETEKWMQLLENIWAGVTISNTTSYADLVSNAGEWYSLPRIKLELERWLSSSIHGGLYILGCICVMIMEVSNTY